MLKSAQSQKKAVGVLSFLLILVIAICLLLHLNVFGLPKYYAVELLNGEVWYGQIADESEELIVLDPVYHFHGDDHTQLVNQDTKRNPPKEIGRNDIFSIGMLSEGSPILKAIRKFEQ